MFGANCQMFMLAVTNRKWGLKCLKMEKMFQESVAMEQVVMQITAEKEKHVRKMFYFFLGLFYVSWSLIFTLNNNLHYSLIC